MTSERPASYVLASCLLAAAASKLAQFDASVRGVDSLVRGLGLGRLDSEPLTWLFAALVVFEVTLAAAFVTSRLRRPAVIALLAFLACGIVCVGVASRWGERKDFGCPCGLAFELPLLGNYFTTILLRDAALAALAALAWGTETREEAAARVRPA